MRERKKAGRVGRRVGWKYAGGYFDKLAGAAGNDGETTAEVE